MLRKPLKSDHELLVKWRNENLKYFFSNSPVTLQSHMTWYEIVESDPSQEMFVAIYNGVPVGTISLYNIDYKHKHGEYGRFVIAEEYRRKGYGRYALSELLNLAFHKFNLYKVYGDVLEQNLPAIKLDRSLGFRKEGTFVNHVYKDNRFMNVVRLAITKKEWETFLETGRIPYAF